MTEDAFPRDPEAPEPATHPAAPGSPAAPDAPRPPAYTPGSAQRRLNRPVRERYPQIRPTSGYGDPRVTRTGPGPGAGTEQEPERSSKLTARLVLALTVVIGQLWGLTIVVDEWMAGDTGTAWWGAGFLCLSFLVVLPADQPGSGRDGGRTLGV
ncbi:hypothetical protein EAO70_06200 [Streptomyces sp. adm13(2018)]|uniref:hypothetical protein n=1 Tax=Streptomyces sp. adm13(2018) TaxID=2479007 RepID=UPI0011CE86D5|nr:hypothetical protein [Streptomyces sp. adm13(2018)]TXS22362.1 hypothetical protein EAO70_06200 [Streptomyces sp. adm13(2018)]